MRYVIDLEPLQVDIIKDLVRAGRFGSVAQFVATAVDNQIHIERAGAEDATKVSSDVASRPQSEEDRPKPLDYGIKDLHLHPVATSMPAFEELHASVGSSSEEHAWLWGQINRILPIKIGVRVLYVALRGKQWVGLDEYTELAARTASAIGDAVRKSEIAKGKGRDERISAGLPDSRNDKSRLRYRSHFLSLMRGDGKMDGAMCSLRLARVEVPPKREAVIGLTEPGMEFAQIHNPVLDNNDFERSLGEEEIDFYLEHVSRNVKAEDYAIMWLLNQLKRGVDQRSRINENLVQQFSESWRTAGNYVDTQRTGLIGRMAELGLICREKVRFGGVRYLLDMRGKRLLGARKDWTPSVD